MKVGGPLHSPEKGTLLNTAEEVFELATGQFHGFAREKIQCHSRKSNMGTQVHYSTLCHKLSLGFINKHQAMKT
jgi:hypothetical protein